MLLVPINPYLVTAGGSTPGEATNSYDVISPTRLFELGRDRLATAFTLLRSPGPGYAPNAMDAAAAIRHVEAGVNTLGSILVPTARFEIRRRATAAIDIARAAVELLHEYRTRVVDMGVERPIDRSMLDLRTLAHLDGATRRIEQAISFTES